MNTARRLPAARPQPSTFKPQLAWLAAWALLCAATLPAFAQTNCAPPPAGLVAWWKAEGNANDLLGLPVPPRQAGGNNGVLQNDSGFGCPCDTRPEDHCAS